MFDLNGSKIKTIGNSDGLLLYLKINFQSNYT